MIDVKQQQQQGWVGSRWTILVRTYLLRWTRLPCCSWLACSWTEGAPVHFFSKLIRVSRLWQCKFEFLFWVLRWDVNLALTSGRPVAETLGDKLHFCQILLLQSLSQGSNASKTIRSIFFRRVSQLLLDSWRFSRLYFLFEPLKFVTGKAKLPGGHWYFF